MRRSRLRARWRRIQCESITGVRWCGSPSTYTTRSRRPRSSRAAGPAYDRWQTRCGLSKRAEAFEHWIRTSFVQMNTELENLYFAKENREQVIGCGDPI